jgi:hypothetical protein
MLGTILGDFMIMETKKAMKIEEKMKVMKIIIIIIGVLSLLFIASNFYVWKIKVFDLGIFRGAESKKKIIEKYIKGVQEGNFKMIERLVPRSYKAGDVIFEKIKKFQSADFGQSRISYNEQFLPMKVIIQDIKLQNGQEISDEIYIEKDCQLYPDILNCKKWYLLIGKWEGQHSVFPQVLVDNFQKIVVIGEIEIPRRDISLSAKIIHLKSPVKGIEIIAIEKETKIFLAYGNTGNLKDLMDLPPESKIKVEGKISTNKNVLIAKKITVLKE